MTDQLVQVGRLPSSSISRDDYRDGLVILPIIGVIYLYGGIYILNKKYFYPAVSHIIGLLDEKYTAVVYCSLNMMIYLFIMFYSTLLAEDNIGISTILGSESFNLLFVMGWMQFTSRVVSEIDAWIFIKDSLFYLGTLFFAVIFFSFNEINWWQALIWIVYFFVYAIYFQKKNERLRDKIALFFGLKDEDDVFSSEELVKMEKKRYSLDEIAEKIPGFRDDPEFIRKLKRQEGALKIQLEDKSKYEVIARFQKAAFLIIFAIQQKNEEEKKQRSQIFKEKVERLYGRTQRKQKSIKPEDLNPDDETNEQREEEEGLIDRENAQGYPFQSNNDDVQPGQTPNPTSQVDVLNKGGPDDNREFGMDNNEPGVDALDIPSNPNIDEMYVFEDDNMSIPNTVGKKIVYFVFFPLNFLYFVVLFYFRKQPNIKTAGFAMAAILLLQAIFTFLIIWWTEIIISVLDIPNEVAGVSFTAIGFSISFIVANLRIQTSEKDPNFLTTFEMVGIYKFGFAGAVGWLLSCAARNITAYPDVIQGLQISALIFMGLFLLSACWIGLNKAKVTKTMSIPYVVSYIGFLIAAILFLIYYRDQAW